MRHFRFAIFLAAFVCLTTLNIVAQETEERVVDEVVAVVNEGVITLSKVRREAKGIVDSEVQQGKKREDVQKEIDDKRGELIANLINEELLMQKAKELGLDQEIEAGVNGRFLEVMKQYNLKTLDALYAEMEKTGVDPQEIREVWRKQFTKDAVLQKEVQAKLYWGSTPKELKEYFEKNKAKFTKPETVTISEIFLSFAGRDENAVREKAKQLLAQLKGGGDFDKLVVENSDRPNVAETKGKVDKMNVSELDPKFIAALKGVKVGGYTEPVEVGDVGINILRVDARSDASSESFFDEKAVRMAIMAERVPTEQKKFMATLRGDSLIKINDRYRPLVSPILFADERKDKPENK